VFVGSNRQRHRDISVVPRTPRRALTVVSSIVVVLALVGGAGVVGAAWSGGHLAAFFSAGNPCDTVTSLVVVADPSIAPALKSVAADFDERAKNCSDTVVRSQSSADTAALLASGVRSSADAWVPDSTVWIDRMRSTASSLGRTAPAIDAGESIASTPVVLAAPATRAAEFGAQPVGWSSLLAGTVGALLPDPESSASSLAALLALRSHASTTDPRQFSGAMIELGKSIPRSADAAFATSLAAEKPTVVVTTERAVAAHNDRSSQGPLVAIYPADGTTALTYPFVRLAPPDAAGGASEAKASDTKPAKVKASKKKALLGWFAEAAREAGPVFEAQGFRNNTGGGTVSVTGVLSTPTKATPAVDGPAQLEILHAWSVLTLRSRMLAVIDVSGSMLEPATGGLRRIDIFQKSAVSAMQKFSGEVELGVWVFSTARNGDQDWEDLSPIGPLSDAAHSQQIADIIASLPERARGDTGLYDTTLAAVTRVRESYDPTRVNTVLLFTDGRNDDKNGIDLATLLSDLKKMNDPLKPVPVIMIGIGPDTDRDSMTQIAKTTGGAAYSANEPGDLPLVLVDALSQRGCRPNC
jgi:Mg-chelatase subunit ChlD